MVNLSNMPQTPTTNNVYMSNELYKQTMNMAYEYGRTVGQVEGAATATGTLTKNNRRASKFTVGILLTPLIIYGIHEAYSIYKKHKIIKLMEAENGQESDQS